MAKVERRNKGDLCVSYSGSPRWPVLLMKLFNTGMEQSIENMKNAVLSEKQKRAVFFSLFNVF